jgi:hypothetical protein
VRIVGRYRIQKLTLCAARSVSKKWTARSSTAFRSPRYTRGFDLCGQGLSERRLEAPTQAYLWKASDSTERRGDCCSSSRYSLSCYSSRTSPDRKNWPSSWRIQTIASPLLPDQQSRGQFYHYIFINPAGSYYKPPFGEEFFSRIS